MRKTRYVTAKVLRAVALVKSDPSAVRKLAVNRVEWSLAPPAGEIALLRVESVIFTGTSTLCAPHAQNFKLFPCQDLLPFFVRLFNRISSAGFPHAAGSVAEFPEECPDSTVTQ